MAGYSTKLVPKKDPLGGEAVNSKRREEASSIFLTRRTMISHNGNKHDSKRFFKEARTSFSSDRKGHFLSERNIQVEVCNMSKKRDLFLVIM